MTKKRFRGIPPPVGFSLSTLADDQLLTEIETAAFKRQSIIGTQKKRLAGKDGLEWRYIDGRPRCVVGSLKKKLAGSDMRLPAVAERVKAKRLASLKEASTRSKLKSPRPAKRLEEANAT
jgi:hypothetical protein